MAMEGALLDRALVAQVLGQRRGRELIELYSAEAEQLLEKLAALVAQGDLTGMQRVAHGLKSSSRYVGAIGMAKLSQELEALSGHSALE
jgi:HPt (histidine-containing phosphotransfer) domain-containing protein